MYDDEKVDLSERQWQAIHDKVLDELRDAYSKGTWSPRQKAVRICAHIAKELGSGTETVLAMALALGDE